MPPPYHENDHQTQNKNSSPQQQPYDESTSLSLLISQPSLPSIPSLTPHLPFYPTTVTTQEYSCLATIICPAPANISSLTIAWKYLYAGFSTGDIYSWKRASLISSSTNNNNGCNNSIIATCNGSIKSLVLLSDKLFSAHQDHKIRVWKIANSADNNHFIDDDDDKPQVTYTKIATLPTLTDRVVSIINQKPRVRIHRHKSCSYVHHADTVSALALSPDKSLLFSVSWDRTLKVWRMEDFRCIQSIPEAHDDAINAIASSSDGRVYTGSADKKIKIWRKKNKKKKNEKELLSCSSTLEKHNSGINALALNSNGTLLYSGACDRSIIVWRLKTQDDEDEDVESNSSSMVAIGALRGHTKSILCLVVVGDVVFSGSADKTIRVWKGFGGDNYNNNGCEISYACLAVLRGHQGPVKCFTATVDRRLSNNNNNGYDDDDDDDVADSFVVYSGSLNHDLKVWRISISLF